MFEQELVVVEGGKWSGLARYFWARYVLDTQWLRDSALTSEQRRPAWSEYDAWPAVIAFEACKAGKAEALTAYHAPDIDGAERKVRWPIYIAASEASYAAEDAVAVALREWRKALVEKEDDVARAEARRRMQEERRMSICPLFWACVGAYFGYNSWRLRKGLQRWLSEWASAHPVAAKRTIWSVVGGLVMFFIVSFTVAIFPQEVREVGLAIGLIDPPVVVIPAPLSGEELAARAEQERTWAADRAAREEAYKIEEAERAERQRQEALERAARAEAERAEWEAGAAARVVSEQARAERVRAEEARRAAGFNEHILRVGIRWAGNMLVAVVWVVGVVGGMVLGCLVLYKALELMVVGFSYAVPIGGLVLFAVFRTFPKLETAVCAILGALSWVLSLPGRLVKAVWTPVWGLMTLVASVAYWQLWKRACPFLTFKMKFEDPAQVQSE